MLITDLDYLEIVETNQIEGSENLTLAASAAAAAIAMGINEPGKIIFSHSSSYSMVNSAAGVTFADAFASGGTLN